MCLVGTDNQLCYFKEDVIYVEAIFKAKAGARCHHGRLQRASSLEPLLPGTPLTAGLYTFLPLDVWGTFFMLCKNGMRHHY